MLMKPALKSMGSSSSLHSVSSVSSIGSKSSLGSIKSTSSSISPKPRWNATKVVNNDVIHRPIAVAFLNYVLDLLLNLRPTDYDQYINELKESLDAVGYNMYQYKRELEAEKELQVFEATFTKNEQATHTTPNKHKKSSITTHTNSPDSMGSDDHDSSLGLTSPNMTQQTPNNNNNVYFPMFWKDIPHHRDEQLRKIMYEIACKTSPHCLNMLLIEQKRDRLIDAYVKLHTRSARAVIHTQVEDEDCPDIQRYERLCALFTINYFHSDTFQSPQQQVSQKYNNNAMPPQPPQTNSGKYSNDNNSHPQLKRALSQNNNSNNVAMMGTSSSSFSSSPLRNTGEQVMMMQNSTTSSSSKKFNNNSINSNSNKNRTNTNNNVSSPLKKSSQAQLSPQQLSATATAAQRTANLYFSPEKKLSPSQHQEQLSPSVPLTLHHLHHLHHHKEAEKSLPAMDKKRMYYLSHYEQSIVHIRRRRSR